MLSTVFVYSFTFIVLFFFSFIETKRVSYSFGGEKKKKWISVPILLSILLFGIVFGIRYNVGIDYGNYAQMYSEPELLDDYEFGFRYLSKAMSFLGLPSWVFFGTWASLQLFFILYALKDEVYLYPFLIIVLFGGQYFLLWMNVIRQDLAACIIIFAITFIPQKKLLPFILAILLAFGFHITAIAFLILYPIFYNRKDYTKSPYVQEILLVLSLIVYMSGNLFGDIDSLLNPYLIGTHFEEYAYGSIEHTTKLNKVGITFLSGFLIDVIIIAYSKKLKAFYKSDKFLVYYNLYYFGALTNLVFAFSYILLRPFRYFRFFKLMVAPYLLYYLWRQFKCGKPQESICLFLVLFAYLLLFAAIFRYGPDAMYEYHSLILNI